MKVYKLKNFPLLGGECEYNEERCPYSDIGYTHYDGDKKCCKKDCKTCIYRGLKIYLSQKSLDDTIFKKVNLQNVQSNAIKIKAGDKFIKVPSKFVVDCKNFTDPEYISGGAYGYVVGYYDSNDKTNAIAVKIAINKEDLEMDLYINKLLRKTMCKKLIIESVSDYIFENKYIIMQMVNGTLSKLLPFTSVNKKGDKLLIEILFNVIFNMTCLVDNNFCYTDIKLSNILYRRIDNESLEIILGDLGSIVKNGSSYTSTFRPINQNTDEPLSNEKVVVWGIGVLALLLVYEDDTNITKCLYWQHQKQREEQGKKNETIQLLDQIKNNIKKDRPIISNLITNTLQVDHNSRWTMDQLTQEIIKLDELFS